MDVVPNLVFCRKNSLSLKSINIYYHLNYGGLRQFNSSYAASSLSSSGNGRSISSTDDNVHRPKCDICFKFNNAINGSRQTMSFHLCPNDVVVRDFRPTAGPVAPPSKLRRRN